MHDLDLHEIKIDFKMEIVEILMKNIIIGISAGLMKRVTLVNEQAPCHYVNDEYIAAVLRAGATPIILPITKDSGVIDSMLELVDGIILSGGEDVDPIYYGEEPSFKLGEVDVLRDEFDFMLLKKAAAKNMKILGICRGMQVMNVVFGGSLYQDLSHADNSYIKHNQGHSRSVPTHSINIEKGTFINEIYGSKTRVNSFHHQAVKDIADNYIVSSKACDGIVESIEHRDKNKFIVGVQWHPEMMSKNIKSSQLLFDEFVDRIRREKH